MIRSLGERRMYVLVNITCKMRPGKTAAQVGHAVQLVTEYMVKNSHDAWRLYRNNGMPKIVLRATEEQIEVFAHRYKRRNASAWCIPVYDAGRTQVSAGTLTALAFCPLADEEKPEELKTLKLLS